MTTIKTNGVTLHVATLPPLAAGSDAIHAEGRRAPTVVLIHGLAVDNMASWYFTVADGLAAAGINVLMYDLRGHGRSERPPTGYRLEDHIDDLEALLAEIGATRQVYVVGNSFGGLIAFGFGLRRRDLVAGVAALESAPPTAAWMETIRDFGRHFLDVLSRRSPVPPAVKEARSFMDTTSLNEDVESSEAFSEAQLATFDVPVLCIYGGDSGLSRQAADVTRLLPRARVKVLPGLGHRLLPAASKEVEECLLSWLADDCGCVLVSREVLMPGEKIGPEIPADSPQRARHLSESSGSIVNDQHH